VVGYDGGIHFACAPAVVGTGPSEVGVCAYDKREGSAETLICARKLFETIFGADGYNAHGLLVACGGRDAACLEYIFELFGFDFVRFILSY